MRKLLTALVVLGLFVVPLRAADAAPGALVFADEFDGTANKPSIARAVSNLRIS